MRLHWSPDSANLVVRIALERFGMAYEPVRVDRARGAQRSPAYLALNPQGLIPVLEDGGFVLFETGAILLHLAERAGRFGPSGPAADDPAARAAALRWLFYLSNTVHADLRAAFYAHRYIAAGREADLVAGLRTRLAGHCAMLEGQLAAGPLVPGGAAGTTGIVEDYLAVCLRWAQIYPSRHGPLLEGLGRWPGLAAEMARIEADPGFLRACAAEAIPCPHPVTRPAPPALPAAEVTG
ncbi:glutathione S-transferase family protein [Paralimibaculum aggregatum]|uniref:Glutathione S-transferase family protein n=1 Tax=Paralimibaculum aggregatum TaxID=3036245 RepID=A0ABQ6LIX3_9RHOB|nr:glutathione S-transferase family protein [Limibaculum sp. NKW23]GMG83235.1 glutathione S-transferase family protein [Limibaculum sp. NKW23]